MKSKTTAILIDDRFCKGCLLCLQVCPKKIFERGGPRSGAGYGMPRAAKIESCTSCRLCEMTCPDLALTVVAEDQGAT